MAFKIKFAVQFYVREQGKISHGKNNARKMAKNAQKGQILAHSAIFSVQRTRYERNNKEWKACARIISEIDPKQAKSCAKSQQKMTKWPRN